MHGYDGEERALILDLFLTPGKRRVRRTTRGQGRTSASASTVEPESSPSPNCGIVIFLTSPITCRQLITHFGHRTEAANIQVSTTLAYIVRDTVQRIIG